MSSRADGQTDKTLGKLLLLYLMRGGTWGYYWDRRTKASRWWKIPSELRDLNGHSLGPLNLDHTPLLPDDPRTKDIYFGVFPAREQKGAFERATLEDIEAMNCTYADFDADQFGDSKETALAHVLSLDPKPTVVIDSGGGYHCYWVFTTPVSLDTDFMRDTMGNLQRLWVSYVRADKAVTDLARVLRIPGTYNCKYDPPRLVALLDADFERLYDPETLLQLVESEATEELKPEDKVPPAKFPNTLTPEETVRKILSQTGPQADKFRWLAEGKPESPSDVGPGGMTFSSQSEADLAFCQILAFWTGGDYKKMDKIFRASGRMRDKWNRRDYRTRTLVRAVVNTTDFYRPQGELLNESTEDLGNARCLLAMFPNQLLYTEAHGWLWYNGKYWQRELAEKKAEQLAMKTLRARRIAAIKAEKPELLRGTQEAVYRIRGCIAGLSMLVACPNDVFEDQPDLLNCANGVVCLKTGKVEKHEPTQHFLYCVPYEYHPLEVTSSPSAAVSSPQAAIDEQPAGGALAGRLVEETGSSLDLPRQQASADVWVTWLTQAAGGDEEVVDYLQLALGYTLTGHVREEVLFYIHGPTRGGKGIFTETIFALLGGAPLAAEVEMSMFTSERGRGDQGFDLAALQATRFVAASESSGRSWLQPAKLKRWTGGNIIWCAHKYGSFFSYRPGFKIWLADNTPPKADYESDAMWARIRVICFPHSHLGREDKQLKERMKHPVVMEGLLAWAVEGAKRWYKLPRTGLPTPGAVAAETQRARDALNYTKLWMQQEAIVVTGDLEDKAPFEVVRDNYEAWCEQMQVKPRPVKWWLEELKQCGCRIEAQRRSSTRGPSRQIIRGLKREKVEGGASRKNRSGNESGDEHEPERLDSARKALRLELD